MDPSITTEAVAITAPGEPGLELDHLAYGLKAAVLAWHLRADKALVQQMHWCKSIQDPLMYYHYKTVLPKRPKQVLTGVFRMPCEQALDLGECQR